MGTYQLLYLLLNAVEIGLNHQEIMAKLQAAEQNGVKEEDVPALLKQWLDEAIAAAEKI